MRRAGLRTLLSPPAVIFAFGASLYALYNAFVLRRAEEVSGIRLTYWEAALYFIAEPYAILYWMVPLVLWAALSQLQFNAEPANIARYPTRTDWTFSQGRSAAPSIAAFVAYHLLVALVAAAGRSPAWGWNAAFRDPRFLEDWARLDPILPLPIYVILLQVVALFVTLTGLTIVVAGSAAGTQRPRLAAVVAAALYVWGVLSFWLGTSWASVLGPEAYVFPTRAAQIFGLGPGAGVMISVLVGVAAYYMARTAELRCARRGEGFRLRDLPVTATACAAGALLLLAQVFLAVGDQGTTSQFVFVALQGVSASEFLFVPYVVTALLALVPAALTHATLVRALEGRGVLEMFRIGTAEGWYLRRLRDAAIVCVAYAISLAALSILLAIEITDSFPDRRTVVLALAWACALCLQALVACVALALGTFIARRVEGGAYAIGIILIAGLPLGAVSRWLPAGQPSLLRLVASSQFEAPLSAFPILTLAAWLAILTCATLVVVNRTLAEIH